jgi:hypothetical protein
MLVDSFYALPFISSFENVGFCYSFHSCISELNFVWFKGQATAEESDKYKPEINGEEEVMF